MCRQNFSRHSGWMEHNSHISPKAPTTTSGSQEGTHALSPIDNPLWDEERGEARRTASQTIASPLHCPHTSLIFQGQLIMKALGVGQSERKPTTAPAPQQPPLCWLNALPVGVLPPGSQQIMGGVSRRKAKIFLCVRPPLYNSILTVNSPIHKTQGQFFF